MSNGLAPGWYPHQDFPNAVRYWDGQAWTDRIAPMPAPAQPRRRVDEAPEWVGVVGWLAAIFAPPIGFAAGAYLTTKNERGAGFGMMALSVVILALIVISTLMTSGASA